MKLTINAIKQLGAHVDLSVDELVDKINAQLGGVDEVVELGSKYQGVIIAKVVKCDKHPDADKLSVCLIDDGGVAKDVERQDGKVQVVCGAPNVREGMTVAWLPPGATVPESIGHDPFVLEARELRGVVSNGMLASPKELSIGDSHDGILELDDKHAAGTDFAEAYKLNDVVIDIENKMFTHRPDLFGWLGIAREIAGIQGKPFTSPEWYMTAPTFSAAEGEQLPLTIKNDLPDLVPRFSAITMRDIKVGPSPVWLQVMLSKVGQKPINHIVDLTNFYALITGQPLHAYDYDKVKALSGGDATIVVRSAQKGEKIALLNGKTVEPRSEAIMIATDKQAIGIAGVMGGSETEVDDSTTNIILECANFDMYSIRRTSMAHGLFTDAVTRFTKGQSSLQTTIVLAKIVEDIAKAGGQVAGELIDNHQKMPTPAVVSVSNEFINARLGLKLSDAEIRTLLTNVEFGVDINDQHLSITAPFWRTDIEIPEDIVEEVGRLHGYDKLPLDLPKWNITPAAKNELLETKQMIRERLSTAGANEVLTYSFVHGDLLTKVGQNPKQAFKLSNALSPDLQYYRLSLTPSLLDKVHPNMKSGYDQFALFEIGKPHSLSQMQDAGLRKEFESVALVIAANSKAKQSGAAYYQARAYLDALVGEAVLDYRMIGDEFKDYAGVQPFDPDRSAIVYLGDEALGVIGEFKPSVRRAFKLPTYAAGFETDVELLVDVLAAGSSYSPLSRFPGVKQDMTLKVPADVNFQQLFTALQAANQDQPDETTVDIEPLEVYQKDGGDKQYSFRFTVTAIDRTLTDKEVNKLLESTAAHLKDELKAERI